MKDNYQQMKRWHDDWVRSAKPLQHKPSSTSSPANSFRPVTMDLLDLRIPLDKILCPPQPLAGHNATPAGSTRTSAGLQRGNSLFHAASRPAPAPPSATFDLAAGHSVDDSNSGDDFQSDSQTRSRIQRVAQPRQDPIPCDEDDLLTAIEIPDDFSDFEDSPPSADHRTAPVPDKIESDLEDSLVAYDVDDLDDQGIFGWNLSPNASASSRVARESKANSRSAIDLCSDVEVDLKVIDLEDFEESANFTSSATSSSRR
ncbi:hypothetical protein GGI20_005850, partial [Coemansia sp. BCRC 34301]